MTKNEIKDKLGTNLLMFIKDQNKQFGAYLDQNDEISFFLVPLLAFLVGYDSNNFDQKKEFLKIFENRFDDGMNQADLDYYAQHVNPEKLGEFLE